MISQIWKSRFKENWGYEKLILTMSKYHTQSILMSVVHWSQYKSEFLTSQTESLNQKSKRISRERWSSFSSKPRPELDCKLKTWCIIKLFVAVLHSWSKSERRFRKFAITTVCVHVDLRDLELDF